MDLGIMLHIYIVSASIGSLFIVGCALMGQISGGGHGHTGGLAGHGGHIAAHGIGHLGHGVIGHGPAMGHGPAVGHGPAAGHGPGIAHGPAIGHGAVGHGPAVGHGLSVGHGAGVAHGPAVGHGAAAGSGPAVGHGPSAGVHGISGGQSAEGGQGQLPAQSAASQATTSPFHFPAPHEHGILEKVLGFFNPMLIALFLAFFGLSGIFLQASLPFLGVFTVIPAFIAGSFITRVIMSAMSYAFARMTTSTAVVSEELIGHMAEVIVPITAGRTGEISYVVNSKRYTSAAKCTQPDVELQKGTPVMILDKAGHLMLVERWTDSFTDPSYEGNKIDFPIEADAKDLTFTPENPKERVEENQ